MKQRFSLDGNRPKAVKTIGVPTSSREQRRFAMSISARNHLKGKVTEVKVGEVMAQVTVRVGQNLIESVITRQSVEEMNLKKGDVVTAVIKATEVMISKED
jgi:molybdopterin-binding protein